MRSALVLAVLPLLSGCAAVASSAYPNGSWTAPADVGAVRVSATRDPSGATEVGIVEAHGTLGRVTLPDLVAALRARAAELGGDHARVDTFATTYELVQEAYTYDCGTTETTYRTQTVSSVGPDGTVTFQTETIPESRHVERTCSGIRNVQVAMFALTGRAFRTGGED